MAIFTSLAAAFTAISSWTISLGALGSFAVGNFLLRAAVQLGVSALAKAFAKRKAGGVDPFSIQGSVRSGGSVPRSFVMGPALSAGSLVWHSEWGQDGGTSNAFYTQVIALSDVPVAGLRRWFIEGRAVTLEDVDSEKGLAAVEYREGGRDHAWVRFHDGTQVLADPFLVGTVNSGAPRSYSSARIGKGIAYAVVTFRVNQEIFTGFPRSKFVMDGVKLYDISKDGTQGGTGAHRWDDPATWGGDGDALPAVQAYNLARGIFYRDPGNGGETSQASTVSLGADQSILSFKLVGGGGGGRVAGNGGLSRIVLKDGEVVVNTWTVAGGISRGAVGHLGQVSQYAPHGNGAAGQPEIFEGGSEGAGLIQAAISGGGAGEYLSVTGYDISGLADPVLEITVGAGAADAKDGYALYTAGLVSGSVEPQWFYGLQGLTAARLPAAHWITQVEKCRAQIEGDSGLEATYRCAGEITINSEIGSAFEAILTSCAGRMSEVGGIFKIYVGAPDAPIAHFGDEDIVSVAPQSFTPFFGLSETVNGVIASYPSPDEGYVMRTTPPVYNPDFEIEDGGRRLLTDVQLSFVPFPAQAQRLLQGELKAARRARRHTHTLPAKFRLVEPGDVVTWTSARNGYDAKQFRVDGVIDLPNCDLIIDITEVDPADHGAWDHGVDYVPVAPLPMIPVRPIVQGVVGFDPISADIQDAAGTARRPGFLMQWDSDVDDIAGIMFEVRVSATGVVVSASETRDFEAGELPVEGGLVAATGYEARAKYIPASSRRVAWTSWISVSTNDVRLGSDDFGDDLWGELDSRAEDRISDVYSEMDFALDAAAELDIESRVGSVVEAARLEGVAEEIRTELTAQVAGLTATLTQDYVTAVSQVAALAQLNTSLTASIDSVSSALTQSLTTLADESGATSVALSSLTSSYDAFTASANQQLVTLASETAALASATSQVETSLNGLTSSVSVVQSSVSGVMGLWGVRVNNNGVISGMALTSDLVGGEPVTAVVFDVDEFIIARSNGSAATAPFTVQNGVVHLNEAVIGSASIGSAHIKSLAVDTLHIAGEAVETGQLGNQAATAAYSAVGGGGNKQIAITNSTGVSIDLVILAFVRAQDTANEPTAGCRIYKATSSGGTSGLLTTLSETGPDTTPSQNTVFLTGTAAAITTINPGITRYIRAVGIGDNVSQLNLIIFQRQK